MKQFVYIFCGLTICLLAGCAPKEQMKETAAPAPEYRQISQDTAKEMMAQDDGHIIVDVRRQDEYDSGHIPEAVCIPNESIGTTQPDGLPDLNKVILVYCRSGNRSRQAAQKLAALGYTKVYDFGGIMSWTGDIVTGDEK